VTEDDGRKPRGWLSLYAASFVLMVVAGVVLVLAARDFLQSLTPLWISATLSAAAIVTAVLGVVMPRRR
jgi:lysylphosphatidylglycerol synthetase-like protein (DUF2156 family)